jgi:hypothetical protein
VRVVCKEDGGVGTDVGSFSCWWCCFSSLSLSLSLSSLSLSSLSSLSLSLLSLSLLSLLSLLASTTGRMEKCTAWESRLNQKVKSKNDELLAKENDIKDKDASLGQAVEDALGPIRTSSDGKKSKMKSAAAAAAASLNADSEGITVEDVEDEDEDEMMDESGDEERRRRRRRRRLLHDDEEKEESDDQEAKRLYDQECHATNGHTLLDLGVVSHPTNE